MSNPFLENRLSRKGLQQAGSKISFQFNGNMLEGLAGETVAAALTANGIYGLRDDGAGGRRGLYCGMGACYDCVVTIDGRAGQRACLAKLLGGEMVRSATPAGSNTDPLVSLTTAPRGDRPDERSCDLLVIGAGPAGLNAALAACEAGASVVVLDERPQAGGQYYKPVASSYRSQTNSDRQFADGLALVEAVLAAGVEIIAEALVWGAFAPDEILALIEGEAIIFRSNRLVLATGAYERPVPIPGWTLPGVMTTGAMQTLARSYQIKPGKRVVIAGNGPLNFQLAADLVTHGVDVLALAETAPRPTNVGTIIRAVFASAHQMAKGAGYLATLTRNRVPVLWGHRAVRVVGDDCAQKTVLENTHGVIRELEADAVALGYGFMASCEIANALGCELQFDDRHLGSWQVVTDDTGRTSLESVFAVGDGAQVGGAALAEARGFNAGLRAAADLGLKSPTLNRRSTHKQERFQNALWEMFKAPPPSLDGVPDETVLCRCENLEFGRVRREIQGGTQSLGVLKRRLRLGMGRCQGRYCSMTAARLLRDIHGRETDAFAPRLPVKPFPASALAFEKPEWGGHMRAASPNLARPVQVEPFAPIDTEIAIIGGGVVGACLAFEFARLGRETVLLERDDANLQASGANAGSLHVQLLSFDFGGKAEAGGGPAAATLPLGPWAIKLWQELAETCDQDFEIRITGGLMVAESEAGMQFLKAKAALERRHGLEAELLGANELQSMAPNLSPDLIGAEWSPAEGKINPLTATFAVLERARTLGVRFERSADVRAIEREGSRWRIETGRGQVRSPIVVNAAGPWARQIGAMIGLDLPVYSAPLQMIVTEKAPALVDQLIAHADRHLSMKQLASGGLVIGGAWTARYSEHQNLNVTIRESIEGNLWVAGRVLPQLSGLHVIRSWAGMNVNIDGAPIVGEVPGAPGFYNCVTSNGYTLAPAVARITAELIDGRSPSFDIKPYLLERFG